MTRLNNSEGESLLSPLIKSSSAKVILFAILSSGCFAFLASSVYAQVLGVIFWFCFSLHLGILLGYLFVRKFKIQGDPLRKYSPADSAVRIIMAITFFVVFVGGVAVGVKVTG